MIYRGTSQKIITLSFALFIPSQNKCRRMEEVQLWLDSLPLESKEEVVQLFQENEITFAVLESLEINLSVTLLEISSFVTDLTNCSGMGIVFQYGPFTFTIECNYNPVLCLKPSFHRTTHADSKYSKVE